MLEPTIFLNMRFIIQQSHFFLLKSIHMRAQHRHIEIRNAEKQRADLFNICNSFKTRIGMLINFSLQKIKKTLHL